MNAAVEDNLHKAQAAFREGDFAAVVALTSAALAARPDHAAARALRVNAWLKLESWTEAIHDISYLLASQPQHAQLRRSLSLCWLRIGNAHKAAREIPAAADAYRKALLAHPDNQDARFNLGILLLEEDKPHAAIVELARVVAAQPSDFAARLKLAEARIAAGDRERAAGELLHMSAVLDAADHLRECARLLLMAMEWQTAERLVEQAIDRPGANTIEWVLSFCHELRRHAQLAASRRLLQRFRQRTTDPIDQLRIDLAHALGLPSIYPDGETLVQTRAEFLRNLAEFTTRHPPARIAALRPPAEALLWQNFLLAYQGEDDREPQARMGEWLSSCLRALLPIPSRPRPVRQRPRIALVSSRFYECTVGSYFASWVRQLGRSGYETILVHVGGYRDRLSAELARYAQGELALESAFAENARRLHDLAADVILYPELGMDARTIGLAALRLAPRQLCAWGHPVTSGLSTIDGFLSCGEMEPVDAACHYTERLYLLPGLGTHYRTPDLPTPRTREELGLPTDRTLYLVPQSLFKLHPDNDAVYVQVATRDPRALFVFFHTDPESTATFRARLERSFALCGLPAEQHIQFLPAMRRADYLRVNQVCDVMLDSLRWSGGNTSLDALRVGLPVVTCPGRFMRGRQTMAMLRILGCEELIASNPTTLAELAVAVAGDPQRRESLSQRIRAHYAELVESSAPLHALQEVIARVLEERTAVE
jgi:CRISPR-associated protein Csy1